MAKGYICPNCKTATFYQDGNTLKCSKCGATAIEQSESSQGKGNRCPKCKTYIVINGICTKCGLGFSK